MTPLEVARRAKDGSAVPYKEFLDMMDQVQPLSELRNLTPEVAAWFHAAIAWLYDLSILVYEFAQAEQGKRPEIGGVPSLPGPSGPFIDTMLTRKPGAAPDFSFLKTFGIEDPDDGQS